MSALAWLFGLGALAIAFPFLLHLIRRTPQGQTKFSSLMFLKPTPPTLTRRSRLENILLLLLRAAAICLIALAFMRPFFRGADTLSEVDVANRRVAILLDTSASMRRAGLWDQAKQQVEKVLEGLEQGDDVALLTFDSSVKPIVSFDNSARPGELNGTSLIRDGLKSLEPSWTRSDLGRALVSVADSLDVWRDSQRVNDKDAISKLQIVVISDMQVGSRIDALQSYQWPDHVFVKFQTVEPADFSNATVQLLDPSPEDDDPGLRVRVTNSEESSVEQFMVSWSDAVRKSDSPPVSFYVPPGTSRVLKVSLDDAVMARQFSMTGDSEDFDNTFYVVPNKQQVLNVVYMGNDEPDDPEFPQYYLRRALIETPSRLVNVRQWVAGEPMTAPGSDPPTLVILTSPVDENQRNEINAYLKSAGTLMVVLGDRETVESTTNWTGARLKNVNPEHQPKIKDYLMLAEIDFSNELFQPFANPRYNDFTRIRFWKNQSVEFLNDEPRVIARFENDDPAVWSRAIEGNGQVFAISSGWQPRQSQLALSSKFVPLINGLIEIAADFPELDSSLAVGEWIEFPQAEDTTSSRVMIKPDGSREVIDAGQTRFVAVDQPGIYRLVSEAKSANESLGRGGQSESATLASTSAEILFAVNVDRAESESGAIPVSQLEMFGVKVGEQVTAASELAQMREMRDRDIEDQQKVWKWLIVAAIVLLIGETWLAGRTGLKLNAQESAFPSRGPTGEMT